MSPLVKGRPAHRRSTGRSSAGARSCPCFSSRHTRCIPTTERKVWESMNMALPQHAPGPYTHAAGDLNTPATAAPPPSFLTDAALGTVTEPRTHSPAVTIGTAASTTPVDGQFRS